MTCEVFFFLTGIPRCWVNCRYEIFMEKLKRKKKKTKKDYKNCRKIPGTKS